MLHSFSLHQSREFCEEFFVNIRAVENQGRMRYYSEVRKILIILLVGVGIYFTVRTKGVQFRGGPSYYMEKALGKRWPCVREKTFPDRQSTGKVFAMLVTNQKYECQQCQEEHSEGH